jgi:hypothetical protein
VATASLAFLLTIGGDRVLAQNKQTAPAQATSGKQFAPVAQIPLTAKQIESYIAAVSDVEDVIYNGP